VILDTRRSSGTPRRETTRLRLDLPPDLFTEAFKPQKKNGPCQGRSHNFIVSVRLSQTPKVASQPGQRVGRARSHTSGAHHTRPA